MYFLITLCLCLCWCLCLCVFLCVHIVDLSLGCCFPDLIESLPWIGRHISKTWHGKGLLLSSHCFIYHPSVCVCVCMCVCGCVFLCVCVLEYHGFSQGYLWYGCMCVWERSWSKFVRMWKHPHIYTRAFRTLDSVQLLCSLLYMWYLYHKDNGEVRNKIPMKCAFICIYVCVRVCVCMFLQHKDSDVERSCILINWSRREGLCVGRQIHTATTSHSPNLGHTHTHTLLNHRSHPWIFLKMLQKLHDVTLWEQHFLSPAAVLYLCCLSFSSLIVFSPNYRYSYIDMP